jgi:hypothetical protein
MKIREVDTSILNEDSYADLAQLMRQDPTNDEFGGIIRRGRDKHTRRPVLSLKHINKLKKMKAARRAEEDNRRILVNLMYAAPSGEEA